MNTDLSSTNRARRTTKAAGRFGIAALVALALWAGPAGSAENFLIPGADFSQLEFEKGAWCRYLVVDEALGEQDSTEVYIGVPSAEGTERGAAYWLELSTKPLGSGGEDAQILKLLVLDSLKDFAEGDSLGDYVLRLYIKKGERPAEQKDPASYEDLSLVVPTTESSWVAREGVTVEVAGGRFACTEKTRTVEEEQDIPTGKVRLIRRSRDDFAVWFSREVPVFRLVKCVIDRSRETETVPRIAGIPVSGKKRSRTTAELTGFGLDAEPLLDVGSATR